MQTLTIRVTGRDVTVDPSRVVVLGSSPQADIQVAGAGVAPQHCRFRYHPDTGWLVEDISGGWGLSVDGQSAQWHAIPRLTTVALGKPGAAAEVQAWPVEAAGPQSPMSATAAPAPDKSGGHRGLWILGGVGAVVVLLGIVGAAAFLLLPQAVEPRVQPSPTPTPIAGVDPTLEQETVEAISSIEGFWSTELPRVFGVEYVPPTIWGGYQGSGPSCGGSTENTELNAFYCWEPEDYVAWDWNLFAGPDGLAVNGSDGDAAVWFVLAHEWGHAVQARTRTTLDPGIAMELQADCYTGAFFRYADEQGYLEEGDSAEIIATLSKIGDESPVTDPQAHGTAEERSYAYLIGRTQGTVGCITEYGGIPTGETPEPQSAGTLNQDALAEQIAQQASQQAGQTMTVKCPAGVPIQEGRESFCEMTDEGGYAYRVRVIQQDNEGNVVWEVIND